MKVIVSLSSAITSPDAIQELKDAQIELRYYNHPDKKAMGANFGIFDQTTLFFPILPGHILLLLLITRVP